MGNASNMTAVDATCLDCGLYWPDILFSDETLKNNAIQCPRCGSNHCDCSLVEEREGRMISWKQLEDTGCPQCGTPLKDTLHKPNSLYCIKDTGIPGWVSGIEECRVCGYKGAFVFPCITDLDNMDYAEDAGITHRCTCNNDCLKSCKGACGCEAYSDFLSEE